MPPSNLPAAVEALLFSSDQPLTLALLCEASESSSADVTSALDSLQRDYEARGAGIELRQIAGGWLFVSAAEQSEWVARMLRGKKRMRLSRAALETLAIIAYKQPVTKSEVEAIRGVDASGVMATLLERNLVTIRGRSKVVGRPLLYGSTPEFLSYFGLNDLTELPRPEELRALVAAREPEQMELSEFELEPLQRMLDPASVTALASSPAHEDERPESLASLADSTDALAATVASDLRVSSDRFDDDLADPGDDKDDDEDDLEDDEDYDEEDGDEDDADADEDEDDDDLDADDGDEDDDDLDADDGDEDDEAENLSAVLAPRARLTKRE